MVDLPNYRTGVDGIDAALYEAAEAVGRPEDTDLLFEMLASAYRMGAEGLDRGELKLVKLRAEGDPVLVRPLRSVPRRPQGLDLRIGPDSARRACVPVRGRPRCRDG